MRIAVDVGGTFTDVIVLDEASQTLRLEKVETTPHDPATGVLQGFHKANATLGAINYFVHGTTLGLNALLTRRGAKVAIVTTKGFRDVYELGRTSRDPMYDLKYRKPKTLVPRSLAFEVTERCDARGNVLTPFDRAEAQAVAQQLCAHGVEAVAVCFLHAYANATHELLMEEILQQECPTLLVSLSHQLSREYREYERTSTSVIDAYIKPVIRGYLARLDGALRKEGFGGHFLLTRSGGGAMTVVSATEQPVHTVLSGPAGGVIGSRSFSQLLAQPNLITLDMGGTSLDASLVVDGRITVEHEASLENLPLSIPTIDIKTIGAGGGSVGWIDDGGHLQMGPQSAGAVPGPACYRKGGQSATFTDAALLVGYLDPRNFLGGEIQLDLESARQAVSRLARRLQLLPEQTAAGMLRTSEAKITGAIREISVERGFHPKDFALLAFGGGGGLVFKAITTPESPANEGNFRPLRVEAPPGTLMHAVPPSATFTLWPALLATEVVTKALAQGLPDVVPACSGGDVCSMMGVGVHPQTGKPWLEAGNEGVGFGGHAQGDGENGIMHLTEPGCHNNPVEVLETKAPVLIERYELRQDSGGPGEHRGGLGVTRAYRFLASASALTLVKKTKTRPWGMTGGGDGENCHVILRPGTERERVTGMVYESMASTDVLVNCSGGGGGWGDPFKRDPEKVLADVRNGYVSLAGARQAYGVVISPEKMEIDVAATTALRTKR